MSKEKQATTIRRRSPRLVDNNRHFEAEDPKTPNTEKRIIRGPFLVPPFSSTTNIISKKTQKLYQVQVVGSRRSERLKCKSKQQEGLSVIDLFQQFSGNVKKRAKRTANRRNANSTALVEFSDKGVLSKEENANLGGDLSEKITGKLKKIGEKKRVGGKRKRTEGKEGQGWSKDQEMALQRAYIAAKPTPHFWKKVARLVPGKSAQDCFDKVHSDHLTPPQPQPRSRARTNSSSLSLSASDLLNSSGPKTKKPNHGKQKSRLGQKKVRKLLQNQYQVDPNYEADLFSVLEPTFSPSTQMFTPVQNKEKAGLLKRCLQRSSSVHKMPVSRNSSSCGATLVSPPVLKQVKNKVLHEKYIDQLHCREAKRKAASVRAAKSVKGKEDKKETSCQKIDAIKAAKNALFFGANDAISQFQQLQANVMSSFSDVDDGVDSDEVEDEDRP